MPISNDQKRSLLSAEADSGISFSNIILAFGTAALGLLFASADIADHPMAVGLSVMLVFAGLYASIFYANIYGLLRSDEAGIDECIRPIVWGNAVSEYGGVYVITLLVPVMSAVFTSNAEVLWGVTIFVILVFFAYHSTRFDLLARVIPAVYLRVLFTLFFCGLIAASNYCVLSGQQRTSDIIIVFAYLICVLLCVAHIRIGESGSAEPSDCPDTTS